MMINCSTNQFVPMRDLISFNTFKDFFLNIQNMIRKGPKRQPKKFINSFKILKPHTLNPNLSKFCHIIGAFELLFQE